MLEIPQIFIVLGCLKDEGVSGRVFSQESAWMILILETYLQGLRGASLKKSKSKKHPLLFSLARLDCFFHPVREPEE